MIGKVVFVVLLAVTVQFLFKTLLLLDVNKRVYNHRPGECRKVQGPDRGSEDIEIIVGKDIAFISSGLVYLPHSPSDIKWKGQIFQYDLTQRTYKASPVPVLGLEDEDGFHPHGLSHWILKDGTVRLFVVVHSKSFAHSIVLLDFDDRKNVLNHVRTIRDEKLVRPNDVVATGPDSFIVFNDGSAQTSAANTFEILSGIYGGGLVHFDGKTTKYLQENHVANGVILSHDRKTLFVSHINHETIGVYKWDQKKVTIEKVSEIETLTGCDNFYIDENNNLWAGCHPVVKDAAQHLGNHSDLSAVAPSQILRFKFSPDFQKAEIVEVLSDDGRLVCASTVACPFDGGKQLLIGTVIRDLIHCDVGTPLDFYA